VPINWHLKEDELSFIIQDCGAVAVFADAKFCPTVRKIGTNNAKHILALQQIDQRTHASGPTCFQDLVTLGSEKQPTVAPRASGGVRSVLYTGGSTGRPKGVVRTGDSINTAPTGAWLKQKGIVGTNNACFMLSCTETLPKQFTNPPTQKPTNRIHRINTRRTHSTLAHAPTHTHNTHTQHTHT
jgi:acyl-CoA synthetase (AMP-forming)/AMP-acid ligase II